jgi:hypothetical protein
VGVQGRRLRVRSRYEAVGKHYGVTEDSKLRPHYLWADPALPRRWQWAGFGVRANAAQTGFACYGI